MAGVMMTACSPDKFDGADPNGIPSLSGADFNMTVDQETNQMIATFTPQAGTYPVWIINGNTYSTLQEVGYQNPEAGTYTIEMKLGNRNGFSQSTISKTFTFNETKIDYSADFRRLCGKEWRIANKEQGHLGCGPAGTAATEWWSAAPNDKKDFGVYDDRITFTADTRKGGSYTYNAGADGNTYVNKGVTKWNTQNDDADVDVAVGNQTSSWSFEIYDWEDAEGNVTKQTYIQLADNTAFPYISSDAQYENPKFRIETLTATKLVLVYDAPDRGIAWRYILTSAPDERLVEEQGFDANSDFNLWKGITPNATFYFNPGWGTERTGEMEAGYTGGNNDYTVTVPDACSDRWQAQFHLHTDLNLKAGTNYDFSVIFNADKDIDGVTVKLTDEADADAIIDVADVNLKAGQDIVFWKSNIEGKDLSKVKLVFDFGHATGATKINVSNVVIKDHANDDGTIVPSGTDDVTPEVSWVAVDSPDNLGAGFNTKGEMGFWWADAGWGQIEDPGFSYAGGVYTVTAVENGGSEWQAQCSITGVPLKIEKGQGYDVSVKIKANMDLGRVTVKVNKDPDVNNDPNTLCYKGDFSLKDGENVLTFINVVAKNGEEEIEFDQGKFIFDFGGAPAGFVAEISDIIIQKHQVDNSDPANVDWCAYDSADNLGAGFNTVGTMGFWWADASWGQVGDPGFSYANGVYTVTAVENGGSEWQAQCSITGVPLKIEKGQMYDVSVDIETNMDLPRVTVKVNKDPDVTNDPNTLCYKGDFSLNDGPNTLQFAGVIAKNGEEEIEFDQAKMIFDFGGAPAGFIAKISKIIIQKHKTK